MMRTAKGETGRFLKQKEERKITGSLLTDGL